MSEDRLIDAEAIAEKRADTIERNLYVSEMNRAGTASKRPDGKSLPSVTTP